jgi:hypothetical protein
MFLRNVRNYLPITRRHISEDHGLNIHRWGPHVSLNWIQLLVWENSTLQKDKSIIHAPLFFDPHSVHHNSFVSYQTPSFSIQVTVNQLTQVLYDVIGLFLSICLSLCWGQTKNLHEAVQWFPSPHAQIWQFGSRAGRPLYGGSLHGTLPSITPIRWDLQTWTFTRM